jgi:hypothetical protein
MPEIGAHIIADIGVTDMETLYELTIREGESISHINKWCYYDEYKAAVKREIREKL